MYNGSLQQPAACLGFLLSGDRGRNHLVLLSRLLLALVVTAACADRRPDGSAAPADSMAADSPGLGPPPGRPAPVDSPVPADPPAAPAPDSASASDWTAGDTRVTVAAAAIATLSAVRTAAHPEFDRIVFEFADGVVPSHRLEYVDRPVRQCGSGDVVPLAGDAWLSIQFEPAQAHTDEGRPTVTERNRSPALPNLLELKLICDFEAVVEWVAAVASPEAYRLMTLPSPPRLVVDIRHARR